MTEPAFSFDDFDASWYLRTYSDVRDAGLDPWQHYLANGHEEGRLGAPVRALDLDHLLWRGFAAQALPELRVLIRSGPPIEQAVAGWVVARHAASKARWNTALSAIKVFLRSEVGPVIIRHPGPYLLAVKAAATCGQPALARRFLAQAEARFPGHADFTLARLDIALAENAPQEDLAAILAMVHDGMSLVTVGLTDGPGPLFDRLCTPTDPEPIEEGPLVSVIVPAFRAEQTLPTCLRGLANQSWRNLEIIVVDDASPDRTAELAEAAAKTDPRIRLIRLDQNSGAYVARNAGLAAARGAFYTVHDSDDWSHPQKIEAQVRPLLNNDVLVASTSHWVRMGPDLSMTLWRIEQGWVYRNVSSVMLRTEMRDAIGFWDRVRINADTEYYHRLIAAFGADAVTEVHSGVPLAFGRNDPQSLTLATATHLATQFRGPRRAYLDAALFWQNGRVAALEESEDFSARAAALYLPQHPPTRPFPAPEETGPADQDTASNDYVTLARSPLFDPLWYLAKNADVLSADDDPVRHYLENGGTENRDPGPNFSSSAWRRLRALPDDAIPLLDRERLPKSDPVPEPRFNGLLSAGDRPYALVFAHAAENRVFGAERSLLRTLERMADGMDGPAMAPVVVLPSAENGPYLEEIQARTAAVEILPQLWRHRFRPVQAETVAAIRKLIGRYRPEELHVNTLVLNAPLIAARLENCPSVVHVRELPAQDPDLCRLLGDSAIGLRRRLLAEADRFVANSAAVAEWLDCPARVTLRSNEVDPALFDLPFCPGPALRVALISSNIAKKGIADFTRIAQLVASAEAKARVPAAARCRFLLIGPDSPDLRALGALPDNTRHSGYADGPVAAIAQTDLVLVLSRFAESFGRTTLEAMAAGRPVICYDRGTPPQLISTGQSGFSIKPDDVDQAARAVLALSVARLRLQDMSRAARQRALQLSQTESGLSPSG